ncbi:MAG: hypothetical protein ABI171_00335 [Collimonas sp.]|uniref:hypothetical protein n=1 Tax=Collimonas sp. TaxID=1963772 RepID=UPI0032655A97
MQSVFGSFFDLDHAIGTGEIFEWTKYRVQIFQAYEGSVTNLSRLRPASENRRADRGKGNLYLPEKSANGRPETVTNFPCDPIQVCYGR